jgi:hypothetical protein
LASRERAGQSREGKGDAYGKFGGHGQDDKNGHHQEKDKVLRHFFLL